MQAAHGEMSFERRFVKDGFCPACGKTNHTRMRAARHLKGGTRSCVAAVREGRIPELSQQELEAADQKDLEWRRRARREGWEPRMGPIAVPVPPPCPIIPA